jgi:hypothetical protein
MKALQSLALKIAIPFTCSIIWAFGKNSGSSFLFSPTDRKDTSPVRNQLEKIEQKLEEIRTEALEPLKLLASTKAILFTRSNEKEALCLFFHFTKKTMMGVRVMMN